MLHPHFRIPWIPEVANLSKTQRRFVETQCFSWLIWRIPYRLGSYTIIGGSPVLSIYIAQTLKWGIWWGLVLSGISVFVLGYIYDRIWIAQWRPEIRRFIQLHAEEIQAAA